MYNKKPFWMMLLPLAATVLALVACASDPEPAAANVETRARLADAVASNQPVTDAEVLEAAIDAGYALSYQDGERVYCKKEQVFGTRVRERYVCLTDDEMRKLQTDARDYVDEMTRRQQPLRERDLGR